MAGAGGRTDSWVERARRTEAGAGRHGATGRGTDPPVLFAEGISVSSGRRVILHPAGFELKPGEWKALVGPNGAGKSTLLKALALLVPFQGALYYRGEPVQRAAAAYRRELGVVLHEALVYRGLTAWENLMLYADLYDLYRAEDAVWAQLRAVGLAQFAHEPAGRYSRGMLQRLALARALLHEPSVLLLDEPLTGLDDRGAEEAIALFAAAKERGVSGLWVTHRWQRAWDVVDEVVQIKGGRLFGGVRTAEADRDTWVPEHAAGRAMTRSGHEKAGPEQAGMDP